MFRIITLLACFLALLSLGLNAYLNISDAGFELLAINDFYNKPVELFNTWLLPYLWSALSLTVLVLFGMAWKQAQCRLAAVNLSFLVLVLLGLQVFVGLLSIEKQLMPVLLTGQVLLGILSFWLLFQLYLRSHPALVLKEKVSLLRYVAMFLMLLICLEMGLGVWSSSNSAGLSCGGFPRCNGQWLPKDADFQSGLDILNGLINNYIGLLSFNAQVAVNWLHRVGGGSLFILLSLLMLNATSAPHNKAVRKAGLLLSLLVLIEVGLGTLSIKHELPLWMMVAHHVVGALLMLPLLVISFHSKYDFIGLESELVTETKTIDSQQPTDVVELPKTEQPSDTLYLRLKSQLSKTRNGLGGILTNLPLGQKGLSDALLEDIEAQLLLADIGIDATTDIINKLTENLDKHQLNDGEALLEALKEDLLAILKPCDQNLVIPESDEPFVILVVGVNGAGKTTTIGKLAKKLQNQGHSVMLAAGDTFRAAAVEQLQVWGERNDVHVVAQHTGADSASVVFDGLQSAKAKGIDVLIADTAGRLQTKSNLMEELKKIKRIMGKLDDSAPHEVLLVLDAGTGQNALSQAKLFNETVALTGLALTKLDGTAKGGVIFALAKQAHIPIRYIGVGEGIDDLQNFNAEQFVNALFVRDE